MTWRYCRQFELREALAHVDAGGIAVHESGQTRGGTPTAIPDPPKIDRKFYDFGSYTTCSNGPVALTCVSGTMGLGSSGYRDDDEDERRRRHDDFIDTAVIIPLITGGSGGGQ